MLELDFYQLDFWDFKGKFIWPSVKKMSLDNKFLCNKCWIWQHAEMVAIIMGSEAERRTLGKAMSSEAIGNQEKVVNWGKQRKFHAREMRTEKMFRKGSQWALRRSMSFSGWGSWGHFGGGLFLHWSSWGSIPDFKISMTLAIHIYVSFPKHHFQIELKGLEETHTSLPLMLSCLWGVFTISILQSRKLRLRKSKSLAQGHNSNLNMTDFETYFCGFQNTF